VVYRELSLGSSSLLPAVSLRCRLLISSYDSSERGGCEELSALASSNFTYSTIAKPISSSNLAILSLVYLLSPMSEGLSRECGGGADFTDVL
jgi:hypothetical protein